MLTTFTVTNLDDTGDGSLRDAIDDANTNPGADIIEFAPAVHGTIGLTTGELEITDDVAINGPGQGKLTISGSDRNRVFKIGSDADVDISHVRITDGFTTGNPIFGGDSLGAGILNNGTLSLDHVSMSDNGAIDVAFTGGGAIFNFGTLDVSNSTFEDNQVVGVDSFLFPAPVSGGAISNVRGSVTVSNSSFANNAVDGNGMPAIGGAISNIFGGTLVVSNSQFRGNSVSTSATDVPAQGGAIGTNFSGITSIDHSSFLLNSATGDIALGGAIFNGPNGGATTVQHSTVVNNQAVGSDEVDSEALGGGVYNAGSFTQINSNVNSNEAIGNAGDGFGGGIYNVGVFEIDKHSNVRGNKASTSNDDVFGDLDLLNEVLAA